MDGDERLQAAEATLLRHGRRNSWVAIVLVAGKNRQIRRMFAGVGVEVLRLIRVAVGTLVLGDLPKGAFRRLTAEEREVPSSAAERRTGK